jgi:hypothetical protein
MPSFIFASHDKNIAETQLLLIALSFLLGKYVSLDAHEEHLTKPEMKEL